MADIGEPLKVRRVMPLQQPGPSQEPALPAAPAKTPEKIPEKVS